MSGREWEIGFVTFNCPDQRKQRVIENWHRPWEMHGRQGEATESFRLNPEESRHSQLFLVWWIHPRQGRRNENKLKIPLHSILPESMQLHIHYFEFTKVKGVLILWSMGNHNRKSHRFFHCFLLVLYTGPIQMLDTDQLLKSRHWCPQQERLSGNSFRDFLQLILFIWVCHFLPKLFSFTYFILFFHKELWEVSTINITFIL